jgi:hypothetical protein
MFSKIIPFSILWQRVSFLTFKNRNVQYGLLRLAIACFVIGVTSLVARPALASDTNSLLIKNEVKLDKKHKKDKRLLRRELIFRLDGRTEKTAFRLKLEPGESLSLAPRYGAACFVSFNVNHPSKIEIELSGTSSSPPQNIQLQTSNTSPHVTIPTTQTVSASTYRPVFRISYTLSPASYILKLGNDSTYTPQRHLKPIGIYTIRVANVMDTTESLPLLSGSSTIVHLDAISRSVTHKITIERRSLVSFSVIGAPKPGRWESPLDINIRTTDQRIISPVESSSSEDEHRRASFVLSPDVYFLEVEAPSNSWPSPALEEPLRSANLTLHIDEMINQNLPNSMKALESWLTDIGLDKILEITEFADLHNTQRGLPRANKRLATFAAQVAQIRAGSGEATFEQQADDSLAEQIGAGGKIAWPSGLKEVEQPSLVISFQPKQNRHDFSASESVFWKQHNIGLWDRIFQKISAVEGISARRIVAYIPIWCSAQLVYLDNTDHFADRHGWECMSASTSIPLGITANAGSSGVSKISSSPRSLGDTLPNFLPLFMSSGGVNLEFLTAEPDFVEVLVRGVRGQVIRGGRDWERLQLTIAVTGGGNNHQLILRVTVDGRIASGLGGYPQDSQFTRDMEPQYSMNLTEYAKRLASALRDRLLQR